MTIYNTHKYGSCLVSDEYKICYVPIPKNASTSISFLLRNTFGFYNSTIFDDRYSEYFCFCILRNPISRFLSGYFEYKKRRKLLIGVDEVSRDIWDNRDEHLEPQINFLGTTKFDLVITKEDMLSGVQELNKRTGIKITAVPFFNTTKLNQEEILDLYGRISQEGMHTLDKFYSRDFDIFLDPQPLLRKEKRNGYGKTSQKSIGTSSNSDKRKVADPHDGLRDKNNEGHHKLSVRVGNN